MDEKLSMKSSVLWNSAGSIFYLGCQWVLTVLVVRLSGVDAAGVLSLAMTVCNIWYCLSVYGMRNFQVSDTTNKYSNGTYIYSRLLTCGASFLGCLLYALLMPYSTEQKACILLYFLFKFSEAYFDVFAGIFQKEWRLDCAGKSMALRGVLSLISFVVVLGVSKSITLTIAVMAIVCIAAVFLYDIPTSKEITSISINTDFSLAKALLIECFPLVVYTLLSSAIGSVPRLIMERVLGNYELGIYGSVATPTLIIQMGATYVFNPFVTLFAEKYHERDKKSFLSAFFKCSLAVLVIAIIGIIGGKLIGSWGLNLLYGKEVAEYQELLIPLIICTIITAFAWLLCGVLTAIREFKGLVAGNLAAVIASYIFSSMFIEEHGMQGASLALALATIVEILILCGFMFKDVKKHFNSN